jgi:site-specific DNA-methyltransferase (adenine-specific)
LKLLPGNSAHQFVTSPPYYWQRDYQVDGQIGRENTVEEYLERLWKVFDEARRVLMENGTVFVNLGDKYEDKSLLLIPHQFVVGMKHRGWIVRNDCTWHKTNCKPESMKSRFCNDGESVFFFAKSKKHYFRMEREPYAATTIERYTRFIAGDEAFDPARHKEGACCQRQAPMRILERCVKNLLIPGQNPNGMHIARANGDNRDIFDLQGRNVRSVWSFPTAQYRAAHFAAWPPKLVKRMLLAGCPPGGVVIDPFVGAGTTLAVAEGLGLTGIGIDLNAEYLQLARQTILEARNKQARDQEKIMRQPSRQGHGDIQRNDDGGAEIIANGTLPEIFEEI